MNFYGNDMYGLLFSSSIIFVWKEFDMSITYTFQRREDDIHIPILMSIIDENVVYDSSK